MLVAAPEQHRGALGVHAARELPRSTWFVLPIPGSPVATTIRNVPKHASSHAAAQALQLGASRPAARAVRVSGAGSGEPGRGPRGRRRARAAPPRPAPASHADGGTRSSRRRRSASAYSAAASAAGRSPHISPTGGSPRVAPSRPSGWCSISARASSASATAQSVALLGKSREQRRGDIRRVLVARAAITGLP